MPPAGYDFPPLLPGFYTVQTGMRGRQSLPHRQVLPVLLCCLPACDSGKIQQYRGCNWRSVWPGPCDGFWRIIIGLPSVRAPATSRIAPSANIHASQGKADANKADPASPFALLVDSAAPKPTPKSGSNKTADHDSGDKQDAKPTKQDNKAAAANDPAQTPVKSVPSGKADKTDKTDKDDGTAQAKADTAATDASQAPDPQPVDPQTAPSPVQPPAPPPVMTAANDVSGDATGVAAPAGAASAPATAATGAAQAAQNSRAAAPQADPSDDQAQDDQSVADAAQPAATAKSAAGKPGAVKSPASNIKTAKADDSSATAAGDTKADDIKADDIKAAAAQSEKNAAADTPAPKAAPQPVQAAGNTASVGGVPAPQASQASNAPAVTQHVQVSAGPSPNLPALAVQIAAKSQGGARQFDIRLDPPELGRVDVRLSIDAAGKTSAHLSADQPQTLDLLQKDASSLTRALRDAGLDVSQDGLNFSLRQQSHDGGGNNNGNGQGASRAFSLTASAAIDPTATSASWRGVADGRLDIRV
jgi:flagellar hook-length control protein FliK